MPMSHGVLVGLLGGVGALSATAWLAAMMQRRESLRRPIMVIAVSLAICVLGYVLTPTGAANLRMLSDHLRSLFVS